MKTMFRIYAKRACQAILLVFLAAGFGSTLNTLHAQESGWKRWVDPVENAFSMEVPQGWHARGGVFRFGYGDVRVMVDVWSPDGKINVRYGDIWFTESYTVPDRYHREGQQEDLGALGQSMYAAYRTGQDFAEKFDSDHSSASLFAPRSAGVVHEHAPQLLSGDREEMRAVFPIDWCSAAQTQVDLMHHRPSSEGCVHRARGAFAGRRCDAARCTRDP